MAMETDHVMGGEKVSTGGDPSPWTALGAFHGMRASLLHIGRSDDFTGVKIAIQGVGHVGQNMCRLLTEAGAEVVIADINKSNIDIAVEQYGCEVVHHDDILRTECDILAPCALGNVIDGTMVQHLRCSILCGAANNILGDPEEDAVALKTAGIVYAPDFVVNAGGLIHLAGLHLGMSPDHLQQKNDEIFDTTLRILEDGKNTSSTYTSAVGLAKERISGGEKQCHAP
jgi:leucine dehydrogenase